MSKIKLNKDDFIETYILDAEGDEVKCSFANDMCVELDTSKLEYISLGYDELSELMELIHEADDEYKILYEQEN